MNMCEWCAYKENEWLLYKSLHWSVYLADVQDYVGRCILVLNRHCGSLSELNISEWIDLKTIIDRVEFVYKEVLANPPQLSKILPGSACRYFSKLASRGGFHNL